MNSVKFLRQGYFEAGCDSAKGKLLLNQIIGLKDSRAKVGRRGRFK